MWRGCFAFAVPLIAALCAGCASIGGEVLAPTQSPIRSVTLNPEIAIVDKPEFQSAREIWGAATAHSPLFGEMSRQLPNAGNAEKFAFFLNDARIDVREIVRSGFQQALSSPGFPVALVQAGADADLRLAITFYGIHPTSPFAMTKMEPQLAVKARLVRDGAEIWAAEESLKFPSAGQVTGYSMDEYFARPQLLANGYAALSRIIAAEILKNLAASLPR